MTPIKLDAISAALVAVTFSGEAVDIRIDWFPTGPMQNGSTVGKYRAALRGTYSANNGMTYPIFDPIDGERELAGWGSDPLSALRALDSVCAAYGWEEVGDADADDTLG